MTLTRDTLSQLSNEDLQALAQQQYQRISHRGLQQLQGIDSPVDPPSAALSNGFWARQGREAKGMVEGALNTGVGLGNLFIRTSNALAHLVNQGVRGAKAWHLLPDQVSELADYTKRIPEAHLLSSREANSPEASVGRLTGSIASTLLFPEASVAQKATQGAALSGVAGRFLSRHLPRLFDSGVNGAAQAAVLNANDEQHALTNRILEGGLFGAGTHAVLGAPAGLLENYFKHLGEKSLKGDNAIRSPQQVMALREKLGNMPVNLIDLLNLPARTRMIANFFKALPLSSSTKQAETLRYATTEQTRDLLQHLRGQATDEAISDDLIESLRHHQQHHEQVAGNLFERLRQKADKAGIVITPTQLRDTAKSLLNADAKALFPHLSTATRQALHKIHNNLDYQPTFSELHFAHSDLTQVMEELQQKGELREARSLSRIRKAAQQDLENALTQQGEGHLMKDWQAARHYFKQHVAPYRHAYFRGLLKDQKGSPQLFHYLTSDQHQAIFRHLSPEEKGQLAYLRLGPPVRQILEHDPLLASDRLVNAYQKLSPKLCQKLLSKTQREQFARLSALVTLVPSSSVRPPRLNFWRLGEVGGLGYLLASHAVTPWALGSGLLTNRALMKWLSRPKAAGLYEQQAVGNPRLHAQFARLSAAPVNVFKSHQDNRSGQTP